MLERGTVDGDDPPTSSIVPAFVLGWEMPTPLYGFELLASPPPWLTPWAHQAGGYACAGVGLLGCALRLRDNLARLPAGALDLVSSFEALGEHAQGRVVARYDWLDRLDATSGEPYAAQERLRLEHALGELCDVPALHDGIEAFLRFESGPLDGFLGWVPAIVAPTERGSLVYTTDVHFTAAQSPFGLRELSQLESIGNALDRGYPRLYFLWENSD